MAYWAARKSILQRSRKAHFTRFSSVLRSPQFPANFQKSDLTAPKV
jgi:hypothetical protein